MDVYVEYLAWLGLAIASILLVAWFFKRLTAGPRLSILLSPSANDQTEFFITVENLGSEQIHIIELELIKYRSLLATWLNHAPLKTTKISAATQPQDLPHTLAPERQWATQIQLDKKFIENNDGVLHCTVLSSMGDNKPNKTSCYSQFSALLDSHPANLIFLGPVAKTTSLFPIMPKAGFVLLPLALLAFLWGRFSHSRQKEKQKKLREQQKKQRLGNLLHHSSELVMTTNHCCEIDYVNEAFCEVSGYQAAELIGKTPSIFQSGYHDQSFYKRMWETLNRGDAFHDLFVNARKDGTHYHEQKTIWPEFDDAGKLTGYISLGKDISGTKTMKLAFRDELTGLYNRAMLIDRLHYLLMLSKRQLMSLAIFYIDLDGFKQINDAYGHEAGDKILSQAANKLRYIFRESDTLARMGGDEFVIVAPNNDLNSAEELAQKSIEALSKHWHVDGQPIENLSASLGLVMFRSGEQLEISELLENADTAMYDAKKHGRNCYSVFRQRAED